MTLKIYLGFKIADLTQQTFDIEKVIHVLALQYIIYSHHIYNKKTLLLVLIIKCFVTIVCCSELIEERS